MDNNQELTKLMIHIRDFLGLNVQEDFNINITSIKVDETECPCGCGEKTPIHSVCIVPVNNKNAGMH